LQAFHCTAQPLYHKNFDLVATSFRTLQEEGYTLYICTDSRKQVERIRSIFEERGERITVEHLDRTLHEGYVDDTLRKCFFTDHQIFDRFHKYTLRSERARAAKVALTLKEIQSFRVGDYVTHIDHGIGRFGGLVRMPSHAGNTQEAVK
jgi:transcription-repair coupling factor (superfamily II helicase)